MEIHLHQQKFIEDTLCLVEAAKSQSIDKRDLVDLEYLRTAINVLYNQSRDWDIDPELAAANGHHPKEDLQISFIIFLIQFNAILKKHCFNFNPEHYLVFKD